MLEALALKPLMAVCGASADKNRGVIGCRIHKLDGTQNILSFAQVPVANNPGGSRVLSELLTAMKLAAYVLNVFPDVPFGSG